MTGIRGRLRLAGPGTMILLDPELDPDRRPPIPPGATRADSRKAASGERLPTARTLNAFLRVAQKSVRLRGLVTVLLTTDVAIRRMNRRFRGKNHSTDVLSFPAAQISRGEVAGDLAISVDTAQKQAVEQGHALAIEIKVLILHGLLHLAGYNHEFDSGEMARIERALRTRLALPLGLIERTAGSETGRAGKPSPARTASRSKMP
jgi:probable rRNA maturation factor